MGAVVVGPLPPPVDGRAVATDWLVRALRDRGWELAVTDTQIGVGRAAPVVKLFRCLRAALRILITPVDCVLVVASGDVGLLAELAPLLAGRARRRPVLLVHHSAAYVRERSVLLRAALLAGGPSLRHVVLSPQMAADLTAQYGLAEHRCVVLDNAALMPDASPPAGCRRQRRVLHLSALSAAKGALVVLDVARRLGAQGSPASVRLVGPLSDEVRAAVEAARDDGSVELGGAVEGGAKLEELASARVFLFPTTYRHEAQPLVVYEAAQVGAVPIVWSAGWAAEQMAVLGLERFLFPPGDVEGLVRATAEVVALSDDEFAALSDRVRSAFAAHRAAARSQLDALAAR